ncbi:MAG: RNA polymerase sigma factor, sigma-70 family [Candidatus Uhrbacteria bacterium GW2011_GWE2_45_35]|uniref:RNA polymerase sigma factor, sigma-70 family n=2 Tax=Candidatus Uhriibacteriota TaxID=1752732 RepID=A0A0G1LNM3_9BACT|nr:MAG: RNA polymerase sigma factor, sigma-70 family [Candidatus Uhrbacteria bacterium GW2011_GWF2_44_350]KKU08984.1 MAG: RNA polymerase sigma factor, sigma-70 family [Candidatus Uhrbacteria bacterium GW2011_GWE2_45_35]HBR81072.1 hypothetical protein [Candidatus Uhrbacteria bacterium]
MSIDTYSPKSFMNFIPRNNYPSFSFYLANPWSRFLTLAVDFLGGFKTVQSITETDDNILAQRMADGDDRAFAELYERYFQKIYTFVVRRVSDQRVAEDLVSDVFIKAFAKRTSFVLCPSFSAWIYRIATNRITDYYRTAKKSFSLDDEENTFQPADHHENVIEKTDRLMLGEHLEKILEKLSERDRLAVTMKYYAEASYEEIAEVLKCTPNNAGVIIHRALKKCSALAGEKLKHLL